jgi:hypothetical protein
MTSFFSFKRARDLLMSWRHAEDSRQIAAKIAHQCLDRAMHRLWRGDDSLSDSQLRGYLRATAAPWIDLAIEERSKQRTLTGGFAAQVRTLAFELLEQYVVQTVKPQPMTISRKSAAA